MALPLAAAFGALGAGVGAAQAIGDVAGLGKAKKQNREELERLIAMRNEGRMGLSEEEQAILQSGLTAKTQASAASTRRRAEQLGATGGIRSGADLARLRQEEAQTVGRAGAQNVLTVRAASEERRREQERELAARQAADTRLGSDQRAAAFGGIGEGLQAAGQAAIYADLFKKRPEATPENVAAAEDVAAREPEAVAAALEQQRASGVAGLSMRPGATPGVAMMDQALSMRAGVPVFRSADGSLHAEVNGQRVPLNPDFLGE